MDPGPRGRSVALLAGCGSAGVENASSGRGLESVFTSTGDAEVVAWITVDCDACAWDKAASEGIVFAVTIDDRPPVHLPIVRGGKAEYRLMLGAVSTGDHAIKIEQDPNLTAVSLRGKAVARLDVEIEQIAATDSTYQAMSLAPFVHARPDTVGKFSDVPLLMWYEIEPTERGKRYRYSVIFSNEDGGTPADRLMATWGRTTDIEYVYSVEVDAGGAILNEDMQGPKHEILPFKGKREGHHPLLWVSTENNMVLDHGATAVRYAPAPVLAELKDASREQVMDANDWTYEVMTKELVREGKIVADAPTGQGTIPDPRRYVFLEGCGVAGNNALAVAVNGQRSVVVIRSRRHGVPDCSRRMFPRRDPAAGHGRRERRARGARAGIPAERQTRQHAVAFHAPQHGVLAHRAVRSRATGRPLGRRGRPSTGRTAVRDPGAVTNVLEMRGIRKAFPGVVALDGVDLSLNAGEVHMLLGENGAGKSTLMKILSGAYRKDSGEIRVQGEPVEIGSPRDALRLGIRVIYQELNLISHLSVAENVFLGAAPTRFPGFIDWRQLSESTSRLLADLGMNIEADTPLHRLSLAQRQMVEMRRPCAAGRFDPGDGRAHLRADLA